MELLSLQSSATLIPVDFLLVHLIIPSSSTGYFWFSIR